MGILSRYLYKNLLGSTLLGFFFYLSLFLIQSFFEIVELSLRQGIPFIKALWIIGLSFPLMASFVLPMAVLFGVLFTMAKLLHAGEIRAILALGIPRLFLWKRVMIFGLTLTFFHALSWSFFVPKSVHSMVTYRLELVQNAFIKQMEPQQFIKQFSPYILYVEKMDDSKKIWHNILIMDYSLQGMERFTTAKKGVLRLDEKSHTLWLDLEGLTSFMFKLRKESFSKYQIQTSQTQTLKLFSPSEYDWGATRNILQSMTLPQLITSPKKEAKIELHKRLSLSLTILIFAFLGLALGIRRIDMRGSSAFTLSLGIILLDYTFLSLATNWSREGDLHPALAMWGPVAFFSLLAIIIWVRAKERVLRPTLFQRLVAPIISWFQQRKSLRSLELSRFPTYLDFYLWTSFVKILFFCLLSIAVLYVVIDFSQLSDEIQRHKVPLEVVFQYYLTSLPQVLYEQGLPLGIMISLALSLTLLERHRELTALRSLGISLYRIFIPFLSVAFAISLGFALLGETTLPLLNQKASAYRQVIFGKHTRKSLPVSPFQRQLVLSGQDHLYLVSHSNRWEKTLYGVQVWGWDAQTFQANRHIFTKKMVWKDNRWIMLNGWERIFDGANIISYREFTVRDLPYVDTLQDLVAVSLSPSEMGVIQFYRFLQRLKESGWQQPTWKVMFWRKVTQPLLPIVLTLFSFPFILVSLSASPMKSLGLILLSAFSFWAILALFLKLGELQVLPTFLSVLSPLVIFTLAGFWLIVDVKT